MKGADQCPKCASRKWADIAQDLTGFYAHSLRVCGNCGAAWEPFDPDNLLDPENEPLGAFKTPCNNCAFRKGSPEQADVEGWESRMIELSFGAAFYCHKGVPVSPGTGHGFAYPDGGKNPHKLRLCRGYLNSIVGPRLRRHAPDAEVREAVNPVNPMVDPGDQTEIAWSD